MQRQVTVVDLAPVHDASQRDFAIVELPSTPQTADLWQEKSDCGARRGTPTASSGASALQKARDGKASRFWSRLKNALASVLLLLIVVGAIMLALRISRTVS